MFVEQGTKGGAENPIVAERDTGERVEEAGWNAPGEGLVGAEDMGYGGKLTPEGEVSFIRG